MLNRIARIDDLRQELPEELMYIKSTGYSGERDNIYYDYVYKWSRMIKCLKALDLLKKDKRFLELGGGLSPIQFILSNHGCKIHNLDEQFSHTWFPVDGKYYIGASKDFVRESEKNLSNITFVPGNIFDTIKSIESNSIDAAIDTCALHIFIGDGTNGILEEIHRVLKPGGYLISIGDIANPYLGKCDDEFKYPLDMAAALCKNKGLRLIEPYDYSYWEDTLTDKDNIIPRKNIDYNDLSLMNMKNDPALIPYGNIPSYPIHLWTSTYILKKHLPPLDTSR